MRLQGRGSGGHPYFLPSRGVEVRVCLRCGIKGAWVIRRTKRLDPEWREGAKVSHANEEGCLLRRLQGAQISPGWVVLSFHRSQLGLRTAPISRKASFAGFTVHCSC